MHTIPITLVSDEDEEVHELPARWAICWRCGGEGKHDHPAFANGITGEEWSSWDYEEREMYRGGAYDVPCKKCHGTGKVLEVDRDACEPDLLEMYDEECEQEAAYQRMVDAERRYGA